MSQRLDTYPPASKPKTSAEEEEETYVTSLGSINRLQEVKITADRLPNPIEVLKSRYNKVGNDIYLGNCGNDYVCMLHMEYCGLPWVNCGEHTGFKPMDGYYYYNPFTRGKYWPKGVVMYIGCPDTSRGKFATVLRATWYNREFYAADASIQAEPEYIPSATLLWRHSVSTDERGEATLHCYTNSIPGSFLVHLQGLSTSGPVSGKAYFRVRNGQ